MKIIRSDHFKFSLSISGFDVIKQKWAKSPEFLRYEYSSQLVSFIVIITNPLSRTLYSSLIRDLYVNGQTDIHKAWTDRNWFCLREELDCRERPNLKTGDHKIYTKNICPWKDTNQWSYCLTLDEDWLAWILNPYTNKVAGYSEVPKVYYKKHSCV
jgi:hypothetical protein